MSVAVQEKILVMDDERDMLSLALVLLRHFGYEAEGAMDGDEALSLCKKRKEMGQPFDAAILDINVRGGVGGRETIKRLRELDPDIRAIVSSGNHEDPLMLNYREHGFRAALPKPYSTEDLKTALSKAMSSLT